MPTSSWHRGSGAQWWAPLVNDLALLQGGNVAVGFLVTSIDLGQRPPVVAVSWADGSSATVRLEPESGCAELRERLAEVGPRLPEPELDDRFFWVPDDEDASPLLVHAWVMQELARSAEYQSAADMWRERLELRYISGDAQRIEAVLHLVSRGYAVRVPVEISPPGSKYIHMSFALAEIACRNAPERLPVGEPHDGIPTYLGPAY